jgi:hypothetical protein
MTKLLVNRKEPSRNEVENRQDFETVLFNVRKVKKLNSPWFYGAIAFSSLLFLTFLFL